MGTKWSTVSVSGYNSSPPSDDGSTTTANEVKWATIKTKLPDPLKTALESVISKLDTALNFATTAKTGDYTIATTDNGKVIDFTASATATLPAASSAGDSFMVGIMNSHSASITISRAGSDTINGATSYTLPTKHMLWLYTNDANDGWLASQPVNLIVTGTLTAGAATVTSLSVSDGNITNVGDIAVDSISADATDINLAMTDNSATAFTVKEGSTAYMTFVTTNSGEKIVLGKNVEASGSVTLKSDAATLGFGADTDVTLTHVADTGLLLNSTRQLQFNDASQNITAPNATTLDINATDEVEINATLADVNANLDVSGTYTGGGLMTTGGNIVIPDGGNIGSASDTDAVAISSAGLVTVSQDLTVTDDVTIGDDLLLDSDAAIIKFGDDQDVTLTHVADTGLLLNSTMQLQFNDASQNINAPSATVLDINATDEVEINATLADVNANLDVSGTYTGGGTMTTGGNIVIPDAGNIGSASDTDAMSISSGGVVGFSQVPTFPNDTIETADIQDNAVTLAKMAGLARGKIIVGDASGDPSVIGPGSNGQALVSDGTDVSFGTVTASVALDDITTGDAASTLATSAGNITIDAQGNDTDIILKGTDGSADTTFLTIDGSDAGTASFNHDVKLANDAAVLGFGADNDVTLTHVADTGLLLNSTMQLQFNDASQNITAPNATTLDINATDEVEINATLADVNANLDVSGTYTGGGLMTTGGNIVIPDAGNIGSASDTDAMAIASTGVVTFTKQPVLPETSRNFIDNGNMEVAQRGTSVSFAAGAYKVGAIDRWWAWSGSAVAFDIKTSSVVPTGFGNSLHIDITTADASLAATDAFYLNQQIEGLNVQSISKGTAGAKKVTVSFWARSPKTGVHIVELLDRTNSRQCSQSYTIASADTFEYHSVTFPADTTGSLSNTNVRAVSLLFWLAAGSDYTDGSALGTTWHTNTNTRAKGQVNVGDDAANNFYVTGVKMETGDTATPFVSESYQENLAKCQRYFERFNVWWYQRAGNSYATNVSVGHNFDFKVEKRTTVTPTIPNGLGTSSGNIGVTTNTGNYASTQPSSFAHVSTSSMSVIYFGTGSGVAGLTAGGITMMFTNGSTVVDFDAEMS